ncbi:MAG: hypothetical protein K0M56_09900 [Kaistella sp.]|nr:hypothetical protein [Kaistella sp.]
MKNIFLLIFSTFGVLIFSQEKKNFTNVQNILKALQPNERLDSWTLVYNQYSRDEVLKTTGKEKNYMPQFSGFKLSNDDEGYYYIAKSAGGKISYITDTEQLRKFIGTVDNGEEAAVIGILEGYFMDEEFEDLAGNYYADAQHFYVELGKVTSKECPFEKTHFMLTVNKKTGTITNVKDNGEYFEVYSKTCANNPRMQNYKKELEPYVPPKKARSKKKRR